MGLCGRHLLGATSIFALLIGSGSLASCGSASTRNPAIGHAASAVRSEALTGPLTKAQATAFAHAVNLTAADLPGYTGSPPNKRTGKAESVALARCAGAVNQNLALVEANSANFKGSVPGRFEQLASSVNVLPTAAMAAKDLAAVQSSRGRACFERALDSKYAQTSSQHAKLGRVSIVKIPVQAPGMTAGAGLSVGTTLKEAGRRIPFYIDILAFTDGPAEVSLTASGIPQPIAPATEQRLFNLLLARARAQRL